MIYGILYTKYHHIITHNLDIITYSPTKVSLDFLYIIRRVTYKKASYLLFYHMIHRVRKFENGSILTKALTHTNTLTYFVS